MAQKSTNLKQPTAYWEISIWQSFPTTVRWLQLERNRTFTGIGEKFKSRHNGVNATIVLLSAACIEGFLVECLQLFAMSRLHPKDTFLKRLEHDYRERVIKGSFNDLCQLFQLALGKSIKEMVNDGVLYNSVTMLFTFRNRIAHANSVTYASYDDVTVTQRNYELQGKYSDIDKYLKGKKIIKGTSHIFHDAIADHFAGLVRPFIEKLLMLIPKDYSRTMEIHVTRAYIEMPVLEKEYNNKS